MNLFDDMSGFLSGKGCIVKRNENLKKYNTMQIGGTAEIVAFPKEAESLADIIKELKSNNADYIIVGNGSNILFDDGHYNGVILILTGLDKCRTEENIIECGCGLPLTKLALEAKNNSLSGLEFTYGIPGTVGGAVYMNAGAYDGQISDALTETKYLDTIDFSVKTINGAEHNFSYRDSVFQHNRNIILSSFFSLKKSNQSDIADKMYEFIRARKEKQPLEYPNSGSIFKRYPGFYTAQLIDECGLKGKTVGGAMVSIKHAGFIINKGSATFGDVTELIEIVKNTIKNKKGIDIECEVKIVRFGTEQQ